MAENGDPVTILCELCGNFEDLRRCARCKSVFYCSREHQKQHWKVHKKTCSVNSDSREKFSPDYVEAEAQKAGEEKNECALLMAPRACQVIEQNSSKLDTPAENNLTNLPGAKDKTEPVVIPLTYEPLPKNIGREDPKSLNHVEDDTEGEPFDIDPFQPMSFPKPESYTFDGLSDFAAKALLKDGYCVIDGIMEQKDSDRVLKEIQSLNEDGHMESGKLAGGRTSGETDQMKVNPGIRSDKIIWLDGNEADKYPAICSLVAETMDALVGGMNMHIEEHISGRTKAMAACYPGGGSSYHKHIDNPNKDGRLITCIMYLNKNWDVEKSGGFLRIYPRSMPEGKFVDVAPVMNRLLVFWSDWRNPHAVHPAYDTRYAVTVWYFDNAERMAAKTEKATKELEDMREEITVLDLAKKQLEKNVLEQRIENESRKALNKLDTSELEAIFGMMAIHPHPEEMLQQLGLAQPICKVLLQQFKSRDQV